MQEIRVPGRVNFQSIGRGTKSKAQIPTFVKITLKQKKGLVQIANCGVIREDLGPLWAGDTIDAASFCTVFRHRLDDFRGSGPCRIVAEGS